jgi:hypothetical protein
VRRQPADEHVVDHEIRVIDDAVLSHVVPLENTLVAGF